MIHHSHVKCDDCEERHTPGNPTECIGILLEQIVALKAEIEKLKFGRESLPCPRADK